MADLTILDVVSFYRSCFGEDKSVKEVLVDSSPQMIAEAAFALHQLHGEYPITNTSPSSNSSSSEAASDIADHSEAIVVEEHIPPVPIVGWCTR